MSADYGTEHFKASGHPAGAGTPGSVHVVWKDDSESALGSFRLTEIAELAELAGRAWPAEDGVEVRYVIETRQPGHYRWRIMWSAVAADDFAGGGVSEEFAVETLDGMRHALLEWRLVRRTTLTADEILVPEA